MDLDGNGSKWISMGMQRIGDGDIGRYDDGEREGENKIDTICTHNTYKSWIALGSIEYRLGLDGCLCVLSPSPRC